ncbi:divergent PAP2 family protein [Candidatus Saganbacteria bacterium]|nr:divergent PAP2 family protein [Candidatus Saganbacteria bacterium]
MNIVTSLVSNVPLVTGGIAFLLSQTFKVVYYFIKEKQFNLIHLFEAAGMPSTHSAMSASMTLMIGLTEGFSSSLFAVAVVFTIIVMYDAMGVRFAAGQQAVVLNKIIEDIYSEKVSEKEKMKELIGHTPTEVFAGFVVGILTATIVYFIVY